MPPHSLFSKMSMIVGAIFLFGMLSAQNPDQIYQSSLDYASRGAFQQALLTINKAISIDSSKGEYYLQRAEIHYALGDFNKTIEDCYVTLRINPKSPSVYLLRGKVCNHTESYGGAIMFFGKAINYSNEEQILFDAYLNRGKALLKLNRNNEAYNDLLEASKINEKSADVLFSLSEAYLQLGKTNDALNTIEKLILIEPDHAPSYKLIGEIAYQCQDFPKAVDAYKQYVNLDKENSAAYNHLANLYLETMQLNEAMITLNRALSINPTEPESYKLKGLVYIRLGEKEKGCNTLFRAMQLGYFEKYNYDLLDIYLRECEK